MKTSAPHVFTTQDGEKLIALLNEVCEIARRSLTIDLYLHYRDGDGWRARFNSNEEGAKTWISATGPWAGLLDALRAEVKPLRAHLDQNDRRQQRSNARRKKTRP